MATTMKTPGVYIKEKDAFGNSVVAVPTAIPVFIGYTQKTSFNGESLLNVPIEVNSLADFQSYYGDEAPTLQFKITAVTGNGDTPVFDFTNPNDEKQYTLNPTGPNFRMYSALKFFYANNGGTCFVISIGKYPAKPNLKDFTKAIDLLKKETEPTMLVIPDAVELIDNTVEDAKDLKAKYANAYTLQSYMINHCGDMMNRVAILDIPGGYQELDPAKSSVDVFRSSVNPTLPKSNSYAAVYYPWLHTTIYQAADISISNVSKDSMNLIKSFLATDLAGPLDDASKGPHLKYMIQSLTGIDDGDAVDDSPLPTDPVPSEEQVNRKKQNDIQNAHSAFLIQSKTYKLLMDSIQEKLNILPPSPAMAGIYTAVDNSDGVWKAPANVAVQSVVTPAIKIDHDTQQDLNKPITGKSVCAIRAFKGRGNLVWGARTLDGNSNDWRYINVRRTLIFLEQSVKAAAKAYVFEPNDSGTWVSIKSMISNFLTGVWKQGGLVGPKPADAFSVSVGLGVTMSNDDIQNGILRVTVKVAVSHPAEFIEITFQQQQQKA